MFFPIGDDNIKGGHKPIVAYSFLALNVIIFIYQFSLNTDQLNQFIYRFATVPVDISEGRNYYTLITNMFLHGGLMHLIGNMLFLWIFADNIEAVVGSWRFFMFYIMGGVIASLAHVWLAPNSDIPSLGASGAIAAVMGAYLLMFPQSRIKMLLYLLIIVKRFYIPAFVFLGFWIVFQLFSGVQNMGPEAAQEGGTAWWAHIGGFVFGVIGAFYLRSFVRYEPLASGRGEGTYYTKA